MMMNNLVIDISQHNGNVDLYKAKHQIGAVIARCSYGWGIANIDKQWINNATQANNLGIPLYAYHFCYARNEKEAKQEADLAIKTCQNFCVNAIYYDMESSTFQGVLTNDMYYKIAKVFCDAVENAGYVAGIYANEYWFKTKLTHKGFSAWTLWLANYGNNDGYNNWENQLQYNPFGHVLLHQFTSNARHGVLKKIEGINSERLDCSYNHGLLEKFNKTAMKQNDSVLNVGDKVMVKNNATWYDGKKIANFVFGNVYEIIQINGNRVVIGVNGEITGAISINNIYGYKKAQ